MVPVRRSVMSPTPGNYVEGTEDATNSGRRDLHGAVFICPEDAEAFGVNNGDYVEGVAIQSVLES